MQIVDVSRTAAVRVRHVLKALTSSVNSCYPENVFLPIHSFIRDLEQLPQYLQEEKLLNVLEMTKEFFRDQKKLPSLIQLHDGLKELSSEEHWKNAERDILRNIEDFVKLNITPAIEEVERAYGRKQPATIAEFIAEVGNHCFQVECWRNVNLRTDVILQDTLEYLWFEHDARILTKWLMDLNEVKGDSVLEAAIHEIQCGVNGNLRQMADAISRLEQIEPKQVVESVNLPEVYSNTQSSILEELDGSGMTAEDLAGRLRLGVTTIKDALKVLRKSKKVQNKRGLGYYRPDRPPHPVEKKSKRNS